MQQLKKVKISVVAELNYSKKKLNERTKLEENQKKWMLDIQVYYKRLSDPISFDICEKCGETQLIRKSVGNLV